MTGASEALEGLPELLGACQRFGALQVVQVRAERHFVRRGVLGVGDRELRVGVLGVGARDLRIGEGADECIV